MSHIPEVLREAVFRAADLRCEYCCTSHRLVGMPPIIDHIIPTSLGGSNERENLAACCYRCNEFKGAKTHAIDPATSELATLFHPRLQQWNKHFEWVNGGTHIVGLTATGRATVIALRLINDYVVKARSHWIVWDWHPPNE